MRKFDAGGLIQPLAIPPLPPSATLCYAARMMIQPTHTPVVVYSVSTLNGLAKLLLEEHFPQLCVEGEVSNFVCANSGHWYFSLKDATSQIRCAMFLQQTRHLTWRPRNGDHLLLHGKISLYAPRGDFQLIAEHLEPAGEGALRRAFEQLKQRLLAEGLFAEARKRALPKLPLRIGIITSTSGAAIRDVLVVLQRRFACASVVIYPSLVQGTQAAAQVVRALQTANRRQECDVILLVRGGGSLEDLWPFNEEVVARAIAASQLPIVTGIGHETDYTIADFVADLRCPTPSAAAAGATPDQHALLQQLTASQQQLLRCMRHTLAHQQQRLRLVQATLRHPTQLVRDRLQQLDHIEQTLQRRLRNTLQHRQQQLQHWQSKLLQIQPAWQVTHLQQQQYTLHQQLQHRMQHYLQQRQHQLAAVVARLQALNPLATLQRGYAIARQHDQQHILYNSQQVKVGESIDVRLATGMLLCTVDEVV